MHVGIVIPAFNVAPWLRDAMRSVLAQSHQDWSLVVVDDGSTDATPQIAATFTDHRVSLIRQANAGVSMARNRGLAAIRADAILFLDADDWLAPDALTTLTNQLLDCPWAIAAASGYARVSAGGSIRHIGPPAAGDILTRLLVRNLFVNGGQLLIRRQAIAAAGDFDPALRYGEDWEYWTRLALQGAFVAIRTVKPLLFVRERVGSAYHSLATDPAAFVPSVAAIYRNPAIAVRVGRRRLLRLRRRMDAENAWVIGREMIRHARLQEGKTWLIRSLIGAPGVKRLGLVALACLRLGPFRPY